MTMDEELLTDLTIPPTLDRVLGTQRLSCHHWTHSFHVIFRSVTSGVSDENFATLQLVRPIWGPVRVVWSGLVLRGLTFRKK
jgi:hypothetical protein